MHAGKTVCFVWSARHGQSLLATACAELHQQGKQAYRCMLFSQLLWGALTLLATLQAAELKSCGVEQVFCVAVAEPKDLEDWAAGLKLSESQVAEDCLIMTTAEESETSS